MFLCWKYSQGCVQNIQYPMCIFHHDIFFGPQNNRNVYKIFDEIQPPIGACVSEFENLCEEKSVAGKDPFVSILSNFIFLKTRKLLIPFK